MQEVLEQILDYLKGIWIKRRYIMIATWLICPIGWYMVAKMPDVYQSSARVYVDTQSLLRPLLRGLTVETNPQTQIQLMVRTLLSRPNLEKIARMSDLDIQATDEASYEAIIARLKSDIKISQAGRDNIFSLSINDSDPELAKTIVQSALTVFIENTLGENRQDSDTAQKFLDTQIEEYENRLLVAENRVKEFKQKYNDVLSGDTGGGFFGKLNSEKARLREAELQLREVQTRLDSAKAQLLGEEPVFGLYSNKVQSNSSLATSYDGRIAMLEEALDSLLVRYTNQHPEVKEVQRRLDELTSLREKELEEYYNSMKSQSDSGASYTSIDKNPVYQDMKIQASRLENEVASLTVRVEDYRNRVNELEQKIHSIPEIEAEMTALNRGYGITKRKYEELLDRRETAVMAQQADETTDKIQFRVIDPPRAPSEPTGPARILFFIGILVVGLGAGVGVSLLMSQVNPVVTSTSQLSRSVGLPVFGVVTANESLGLQQWNRRKTLVFMASNLALIILLMAFMSYFLFPEAIQAPLQRIF